MVPRWIEAEIESGRQRTKKAKLIRCQFATPIDRTKARTIVTLSAMTFAGVTVFILVILFFVALNGLIWVSLTRLHPTRRRLIAVLFVAGNLLWPVLPFILSDRTSPTIRVVRALLGPPWFTWLLFILLYSLFVLIVGATWIPFRSRIGFTRFGRWPSRIFLMGTVFFCLIGLYSALVPLRIERPVVASASVPAALNGTKIALLSDLHVGLFSRRSRLEKISSVVTSEKPDLVLLSGDLIDDDPFFVPKLLEGLSEIDAPILAVLGNHEIYGDPHRVIEQMKGSKIRLLLNEGYELRRGTSSLWIAGITDYAATQRGRPELKPDLKRALIGRPQGAYTIALAHQPKVFADARALGIPLSLCGHTHGGQFGIRALGFSLAGLFLPYHMGMYEVDGMKLYINTGTGFWVVPLRTGMTPEITIVTLRSEAQK